MVGECDVVYCVIECGIEDVLEVVVVVGDGCVVEVVVDVGVGCIGGNCGYVCFLGIGGGWNLV